MDNSWTVVKKKKKKNKNKKPYQPTYTNDTDVTYLRAKQKYEHKQRYVNKSNSGYRTSQLDGDTSHLNHNYLRSNVKQAIIKGRNAKNLTRTQLAQMINVKPNVITEYESGNPIVNKNILRKLEKVLKIRLVGGNIGKKI